MFYLLKANVLNAFGFRNYFYFSIHILSYLKKTFGLDYEEDKLAHVFAHDKNIRGEYMEIKEKEKDFWEQLIELYLFPLNEDKEHQRRTQSELTELR